MNSAACSTCHRDWRMRRGRLCLISRSNSSNWRNCRLKKIVGTPAGILVLRTLKAEQFEQLLGAEVWDESII